MDRLIKYTGLVLLLLGALSLGYAVWCGPSSWHTDGNTFWGTPIGLFVFWIGLAHAGTLLSAIFLALDIKLDKKTSLLAELSTLVCLIIASIYPLMHLGVIGRFYMLVPFLDVRNNIANVRSPLVWDFCSVTIYGVMSFIFFATHLFEKKFVEIRHCRKYLAWLLFPLVVWVHSVVSMDFASTFVPQWIGTYFSIYFVVGAIYSGLALVNLLLMVEGYRMRLLEKLMLLCSWIICIIWCWDFLVKGYFSVAAFIFAGVLPQFMNIALVRDSKVGRSLVMVSVLLGLMLERLFLVSDDLSSSSLNHFGWVDIGLVLFGMGAFVFIFETVKHRLFKNLEVEGTYIGEVDADDLIELSWRTKEPSKIINTKLLRQPLLVGFMFALLFCVWCVSQLPYDKISIGLANLLPVAFPIMLFVTAITLLSMMYANRVKNKLKRLDKKKKHLVWLGLILICMLVGFVFGMAYFGGTSPPNPYTVASQESSNQSLGLERSALLWNARCASCHGIDGQFNLKFVREFYPLPQKLDLLRMDSLGTDSLERVILEGRVNMNPYKGRISNAEAKALVRYMKFLAGGER